MAMDMITLEAAIAQLQPPVAEGKAEPKQKITPYALETLLRSWGVKVIRNKGFPASYMGRLRTHFNANTGKTGLANAIEDARKRNEKK